MKILSKSGNEMILLALAADNIMRGDYLLITEKERDRHLVAQVYDESYLEALGAAEDMVRQEVVGSTIQGVDQDPIQLSTISSLITDMRVLHCKIRGGIEGDHFASNIAWLPLRVGSEVKKIPVSDLLNLTHPSGIRSVLLGDAGKGETLETYIESLDGGLNIIAGKKGSGKSHLAKLLVTHLAQFGAYIFIFDLNGEYGGLAWRKDGTPSSMCRKIVLLEPGKSLRFSLDYLGKRAISSVLTHVLDIPGVSLREFLRIWDSLLSRGALTMRSLGDAIGSWKCNELVRDALFSRYYAMLSSRLFSEHKDDSLKVEDIFSRLRDGCTVIVSLKGTPPITCRMVVELILAKIIELLEHGRIPPCFLFAEEAHLYLRETYWEDVVTRMRHFGIFPTFITNQPDALKDSIYRQADNFFIFNFTNDSDLEIISRFSPIDSQTVKSIVRLLPQGTCLALGKIVRDLPVVFTVANPDVLTLGETKLFFCANRHLDEHPSLEQILSDRPSTSASNGAVTKITGEIAKGPYLG